MLPRKLTLSTASAAAIFLLVFFNGKDFVQTTIDTLQIFSRAQ